MGANVAKSSWKNFVNCLLSVEYEDLVVKYVVILRFALIGPDRNSTTYLFNIKYYENMSMSNCLCTVYNKKIFW